MTQEDVDIRLQAADDRIDSARRNIEYSNSKIELAKKEIEKLKEKQKQYKTLRDNIKQKILPNLKSEKVSIQNTTTLLNVAFRCADSDSVQKKLNGGKKTLSEVINNMNKKIIPEIAKKLSEICKKILELEKEIEKHKQLIVSLNSEIQRSNHEKYEIMNSLR